MKICGIEFAPIQIPLERRLQTFAVIYFYAGIIFSGPIFVCICILLLIFQYYQLCLVPLLYIIWIAYDYNICNCGGRRRDWYRRLKIWKYFRDYFPVRMIKTCELPPSKNYIMCYHPHGILCHGAITCFCSESTNFKEEFPGLTPRILMQDIFFRLPLTREQLMLSGACSVTWEAIEWLLTKEGTGNALALVVGGASEALEAHSGSATLILKRRKGFIKLALKHNASLVPMFAFGENDCFNQVQNPDGSYLRRFQNKFTKIFGFTIPFYHGRGIFQYSIGLLPFRKPITVVSKCEWRRAVVTGSGSVGKPIDLEVDPEPTEEKVNITRQLYIDCLTELFEEHKAKYSPNLQLKIT